MDNCAERKQRSDEKAGDLQPIIVPIAAVIRAAASAAPAGSAASPRLARFARELRGIESYCPVLVWRTPDTQPRTPTPRKPTMSTATAEIRDPAVIEEFNAMRKNTLRGFARVLLSSGMIVHDVAIHAGSDGKLWASPPSKPMIDRNGCVMHNTEGKVRYVPVIGFMSKERRDQFSAVVVEAVRASHPEALS
jgi:hypothetical protein